MLDLEALAVVDAIDRRGSYAGAALELDRVPSAISYTVQKLEQEIGVTLFQKQGRNSILTAAGRVLLTGGRDLLKSADALVAAIKETATGWEPALRIAVDSAAPTDRLYDVLSVLYRLQPNLEISVREEVLAGTWEALLDDRVDLAVGAIKQLPDQYLSSHTGIRKRDWIPLEQVFVASPAQPILSEDLPLEAETIHKYRSIVVQDSSRSLARLSRGYVNRNRLLRVPTMAHKIEAHCKGLGVGFVPRHLLGDRLREGELIELAVAEPPSVELIQLAYRAANRGKSLKWVVDALLDPLKVPGDRS